MRKIKATVSGSFQRHLEDIQRTVDELKFQGVQVLSPEKPIIVDSLDGFVFVESDRHRSVRLVQDRHLASIADSDFLWLENSDGYVGQSAAFELGFAAAAGVPIFSDSMPADLTMQQYVQLVPSIDAAVSLTKKAAAVRGVGESLLVDPVAAADSAAAGVENLRDMLTRPVDASGSRSLKSDVSRVRKDIIRSLRVPVSQTGR